MSEVLRILSVVTTAAILTACGGGSGDGIGAASTTTEADPSGSTTTPVEGSAVSATLDQATIDAATAEGSVLVYGNPNDEQLSPVIDAFEAAYPEISIEALSLSGSETFQRYLSEDATGVRTADVLVNSDAVGWLDIVGRGGIVDYDDPNLADLPDYANLAPGVFAMSEDPLIAVFNNAILPEAQQPTTLAGLADIAADYDGRIGTVDIEGGLGYSGTYAYVTERGEDGWNVIETLGAHTGVESGAGGLATKLQSGEYAAAYNVSGALRALAEGQAGAQILNWRYLEDATPLIPRGIGVTAGAQSPNAAKLFVNFVLSVEGQEAACAGGFTPYRDGVDCAFGLDSIEAAIGAENVQPMPYDEAMVDDQQDIVDRWNTAFGR